jgi:CheY-like chemotaxis protein
VAEPFEAISRAQKDPSLGGILIHAPRTRVREAIQACRALRPLTRAAIMFASDDAVRSTDRIDILEAGADDCLSGGIDFRELDLRLRQAIAAGSKPVLGEWGADAGERSATVVPIDPEGGRVTRALFCREVLRRANDPVQKFFCVLDVTSSLLHPERVEELLAPEVRAEQGDLVSADSSRCAVLLQGAREGQLGPFLSRLRARLDDASGGRDETTITVLSHPGDSERIATLLGTTSGTSLGTKSVTSG